jgi:hypothetical protein
MFFPKVDCACDLRRKFVMARFQMDRYFVTGQDDCMNINTPVLGIPKMRKQLLRPDSANSAVSFSLLP